MPHQCQAIKATRHLCGKNATRRVGDTHPDHLHFCGTHKNTYRRDVQQAGNAHHVAGQCFQIVRGPWEGAPLVRRWRWCPHAAAEGAPYCPDHEARRQNYIAAHPGPAAGAAPALNNAMIMHALVEGIAAEEPPVTWQRAARALAEAVEFPLVSRRRAALRYYRLPRARDLEDIQWHNRPGWRFDMYWRWLIHGRIGPEPDVDANPVIVHPPPAVVPRLGMLARDAQNVHTRVVTDQTNTATEKLLAVKVPESQQTEKALAVVWLGGMNIGYSAFLRVANDVNRWFNTKDCRTIGDNMYRRLLRGLVALIGSEKDPERKAEMYRRAWEECHESVGMCCEGHISRLCNVLVGFDEAFQPPVAFGEILQSKMAAIAGLDASEEEKRRQANAFFDEHGTPAEERVAWLEAF